MPKRDPRTYAVIGAAMEVHSQLGCGFLEAVYQEALAIELQERKIPFGREVALPIEYKRRKLGTAYRADFICFDSVIVEVKALAALGSIEKAQVLNYLKASRLETALLINFGAPSLEFERFILSGQNRQIASAKSEQSADQPLSSINESTDFTDGADL